MIKSSSETFERSTLYSSVSRAASGELKFHCCRTISRKELPRSADHLRLNSCVRWVSVSSNTTEMRRSRCGWSKIRRLVWTPGSAARQPPLSCCKSADSIGKALSSEVTSTDAVLSKSSHPCLEGGL